MSVSSTEALALIERAFPRVPIAMERAFADWGRTYPDTRSYRAFAEGRTWDALDRRFLELRDDALGFLGTRELAAILPAALAALVGPGSPSRPFPYSLGVILRRPGPGRDDGLGRRRFDALREALSAEQRRAVAAALRCFVDQHPEAGPTESLQEALDSCWGADLEP